MPSFELPRILFALSLIASLPLHFPSPILFPSSQDGTAPLHVAAMFNFVEMMNLLLSRKDINLQVKHTKQKDLTPLHFAVLGQQPKMVYMLMAAGADPNAKSPVGTPREMATSIESSACISCMMKFTQYKKALVKAESEVEKEKARVNAVPKDQLMRKMSQAGIDAMKKMCDEVTQGIVTLSDGTRVNRPTYKDVIESKPNTSMNINDKKEDSVSSRASTPSPTSATSPSSSNNMEMFSSTSDITPLDTLWSVFIAEQTGRRPLVSDVAPRKNSLTVSSSIPAPPGTTTALPPPPGNATLSLPPPPTSSNGLSLPPPPSSTGFFLPPPPTNTETSFVVSEAAAAAASRGNLMSQIRLAGGRADRRLTCAIPAPSSPTADKLRTNANGSKTPYKSPTPACILNEIKQGVTLRSATSQSAYSSKTRSRTLPAQPRSEVALINDLKRHLQQMRRHVRSDSNCSDDDFGPVITNSSTPKPMSTLSVTHGSGTGTTPFQPKSPSNRNMSSSTPSRPSFGCSPAKTPLAFASAHKSPRHVRSASRSANKFALSVAAATAEASAALLPPDVPSPSTLDDIAESIRMLKFDEAAEGAENAQNEPTVASLMV